MIDFTQLTFPCRLWFCNPNTAEVPSNQLVVYANEKFCVIERGHSLSLHYIREFYMTELEALESLRVDASQLALQNARLAASVGEQIHRLKRKEDANQQSTTGQGTTGKEVPGSQGTE